MSAPAKILTASEPWAEYQLEDGTLLRFRFTACNFRRTGKQTAEDDPEYSFSQQVQVETHARPVAAAVRQLRAVPQKVIADECDYCFKARPCGCVKVDNGMPSDSPYCAPAEDAG